MKFNYYGFKAIYVHEMNRFLRTLGQSLLSPVIGDNKMYLDYTYSLNEKRTGITNLLQDLKDTGLKLRDLKTEQSNLEKIFVNLVKENNEI